ncbi:hypothetical protein [Fibrella aestuarina]|uniref:hypothetical protein n=1 Tax=Fibrella aestuarina TaxID=651143 RepID=UPI0011D2A4E3|nr:hypothetical protein [Fibrella aestuarina]
MIISQRLRQLAGLLSLAILAGLGCKNESVNTPEVPPVTVEPNKTGCGDGTCCGLSPKIIFAYNETLVAEPVVLGGPPYNSSWGVAFGRQIPKVRDTPIPTRAAVVCELSYDKVTGLPVSPVVAARDTSFKPTYRVWGRVYTGTNITVTGRGPERFVYIERIERMN